MYYHQKTSGKRRPAVTVQKEWEKFAYSLGI
jgi:hypothetical protein